MNKKRLLWIFIAAVFLLLIPLIAMQFTEEENWTPFDFAVAGFLFFGGGLLFEVIVRKIKDSKQRFLVSLLLLITLLLVWAELAVGIFGTRFGGS